MHRNNFDFLRLLFASFVIVTHSYTLTGLGENDWLYQWSGGQTVFSYIGVRGFFIISGFLIYASLIRSNTLHEYYYKRLLRLYPGLFIALHLTVLLGLFVSTGRIEDYIANNSAWTYIPNNLNLFKLQYKIDEVFEQNPYQGFVNGSLWTITYELVCYIVLSVLFFIKSKKSHRLILSTVFLAVVITRILFFDAIKEHNFYVLSFQYIDLFAYFTAGSLLAAIDINNFAYKRALFVSAVFVLILSFCFGSFHTIQFFTLPLIVILFGLESTRGINTIGVRFGDMSYGIYIYGFVIQQALMHYFNFNFLELMLWSLALSLFFGYASWHLVEKQALRAKNITAEGVYNKLKLSLANVKRWQ